MDRAAQDEALLARIGIDEISRKERALRRGRLGQGLAFMAPALLLVIGLLLAPVAANVWLSFTRWKKFAGFDEFAGFSNYQKLPSNPFFTEALVNTAIWVGASLIFPIALGLGMAIFFRNMRGAEVFKSIVFIPRVLAPTSVGVLWFYIYAPDGLLNRGLSLVTGSKVDIGWLYESTTVTPAIIATFVWQTAGLVMVLLLLGLAAIPRDPVEAALIDGAKPGQIFRHITLPLLMPTLLMVMILSVLAGFTVFDLLWVMGANYPGQRSLALAVFMYFEAFQKSNWAFGSAVAVVIGLVVLSVTWIQTILQTRVDQMVR